MTLQNSIFSRVAFLTIALFAAVSSASAISLEDFSVYGANQVFIGAGSTVESGLVGSNTEVRTNGGATINEDIHSGGDVILANSVVVGGNVFATGNFQQGAAGGRPGAGVGGNIDAAGSQINIGSNTVVGGTLTHVPGATVVVGPGANIVGGTVSGVPTPPSLPTLPAATAFVSGGSAVTTGGAIAPGSYGALNLGNNQALTLTAGDYFFDSWDSGSGLDLLIDLTGGDINLYITGLASFGNNTDVTLLNGLADQFYLEGLDEITIGAGSNWFGYVYAPNNRIHVGGGSCCTYVTGALWSGTVVDLEHGVTVTYQPSSNTVVPEPSTWFLLSTGLFGLAYVAQKRRALSVAK